MTNSEKLRDLIATPAGQQAYCATIEAAQADGIAAYESAVKNGLSKKVARVVGQEAKDYSLLRRIPIAITAIARVRI